MPRTSHKLNNSFEGALAGGGDAATSPLYVFGPFLRLIIPAGVAAVTFGGSVWLAVLTIVIVSAVYRLVMQWVTDGSGGSGLSEDEFGGWAVKVNAAITFIEYTLTFLVSMAAMITFMADRLTILNGSILGISLRSLVAILLSIVVGWLVNRGPRVATRAFGPATAGVLALLWALIFATLIKTGFHLPNLTLMAFHPHYLQYTIGGYVRILAVMTGIEVFANLVAAYQGKPEQKSRKAFGSLMIIMGTTAATMLIVGPAIFMYSDPENLSVSVFTQAMDHLLPDPLPYLGSLIGVIVLMSASAASAQGLQNLALGLKERHYIPPAFGSVNNYHVADKPVWLEISIVSFSFLVFGTQEETYLALYAAGVFILLSMTAWAVTKRLVRESHKHMTIQAGVVIVGASLAAMLTTGSTLVIFWERFLSGAWIYFVLIPCFYFAFTYFRQRIGVPSPEFDYLGHIDANLLAGFGFGQFDRKGNGNGDDQEGIENGYAWIPEAPHISERLSRNITIKHVGLLVDGSSYAAQAIPMAQLLCESTGSRLLLISTVQENEGLRGSASTIDNYVCMVAERIHSSGVQVNSIVRPGSPVEVTQELVLENQLDLIVTATRGGSGENNWLREGLTDRLVRTLDIPVFLVQVFESGQPEAPHIGRILVALDGSVFSEQLIPYARLFGKAFGCDIILISVPAVPESEKYRAPVGVIQTIRKKAVTNMRSYLDKVAKDLQSENLDVHVVVTGSYPARTIVDVGKREGVDLILITSQGRGGLDRFFMGSVAQQVVQLSDSPVFILPINHP